MGNIDHLLAGICGGVTSTLVLHPLDLLKVRFAVSDGQSKVKPNYRNIPNAFATIVRDEGGLKGLYKGVTPNCLGAGASWGLYFLFYNSIKTWMIENDSQHRPLGPVKHMTAAACAGGLTAFITNPIFVVKTRLCLQYDNHSAPETKAANLNSTLGHNINNNNFRQIAPDSKRYSGTVDAFKKVYKYEGIAGLYRGFVPGLIGVSHGSIQLMAYEEMKKAYIQHYQLPHNHDMGTLQYLYFAALSKFFAASLTYPCQVVRARLQDQHTDYKGIIDVVTKTWRYESFAGFYKGFRACLLHVTPNVCIVFTVYETVKREVKRREASANDRISSR